MRFNLVDKVVTVHAAGGWADQEHMYCINHSFPIFIPLHPRQQTKRMLMRLACCLISEKKTRKRAETDKSALYHAYDLRTHQFIAHIRRVHPLNKDIEKEVEMKGRVVVKAANPLAAPGVPLYFTHSKTNSYNNIFL